MLRRLLHALGLACLSFAMTGRPLPNRAARRTSGGGAAMLDRALD